MSSNNDHEQEAPRQQLVRYRGWLDATAGLAPTTVTSYTAHIAAYLHWLADQHPNTSLTQTQKLHVEG